MRTSCARWRLKLLASIASFLNSDDEDIVLTHVLWLVREVGVELLGDVVVLDDVFRRSRYDWREVSSSEQTEIKIILFYSHVQQQFNFQNCLSIGIIFYWMFGFVLKGFVNFKQNNPDVFKRNFLIGFAQLQSLLKSMYTSG